MSTLVSSLISRAPAAEREADFAARVAETQRRIFQIAYSVLADVAEAEDIAQEALLRAYQRYARLRDPSKFRAWVGRIAFRLALNRRRGHRRQLARDTAWHSERSEAVADGASDATERIFLNQLRAAIERLPEKLHAVLLLSAIEGMDAREVADVLRIPVGTVRSRLHLARKRLLEVMKP